MGSQYSSGKIDDFSNENIQNMKKDGSKKEVFLASQTL
jgi:hypothetical protein